MYSIVLMMALTNNGANPEVPVAQAGPKASYGNQLQTEQYRGRRRGCCGGGGGCYGGGGGCSGGGGCYGGGGGGRRGYAYDAAPGGYYAYDQGYPQGMVGANMQQQDYQAFYAGPEDRDRDMPARLQIFLPPQARLTIDGTTTQQTGSSREFESPSLRAGKSFTYTLRAEMPGPDGQAQTITRKVNVRPGMVTRTVLDMRAARNDRDRDDRTREQGRPEEVRPPKERKDDADRPRERTPEDVKPPKEKKERKDNPQE
jgi:uncharacterized protein (TIGR03000 family)